MIVNENITGIGIRTTTEGRARVVYTSLSATDELDAYDGDFPIAEAREIMREHRVELAALKPHNSQKSS